MRFEIVLAPEAVEDLLDWLPESRLRFLRRVENARKSLRAGRGVRLEEIK